ncbi:MAG: aminotransferase class IV [Marinilabilia sp.]
MEHIKLKELYEVFRVESGVALFLEDHLERLFRGARKAGIIINMDFFEAMEYVDLFLASSGIANGNVRLSFYFENGQRKSISYEARFIPHQYPPADWYRKGVACMLMYSERINPETKIANPELRNRANELISQENVFEALLVNRDGEITEGSRSNVFFIHDDALITAPDKKVLPGVVQKKTIFLAEKMKIPVEYRSIKASRDLENMDACFITGTSPRILPVNRVENIKLQASHPLTEALMGDFNEMIQTYITDHKK